MSRIHEALRRAEQNRVASEGNQSNSRPAPKLPPAPISAPAIAVAPLPAQPPANIAPSFSNLFTFDLLVERCAKSQWKLDPKTMLFFNTDENKSTPPEFHSLRSRLYEIRKKMSLKKVLITSALPREGRSFVAANLAHVMVREQGRRALLIDADLRGSRLHSTLGTPLRPGLSEYLRGEVDEFSILQQGGIENLFFIPAGRSVPNPAELVTNGRLKTLLRRVEPVFDWIVVDSPPAVPALDASLLADLCDGVLMVVRSNITPLDAIKKARRELQGKTLIGLVLNGVSSGAS